MLKKLAYAIIAVSLAACTAATTESTQSEPADGTTTKTSPSTYTPISFDLKSRDAEPTAAERAKCEKAGGTVRRAGLLGVYHCVQKYPDAGNPCNDSSECTGQCRTTTHEDIGKQQVIGACQQVDVPFGCYGIVENGVVGAMLCVD